MRLLLKRLCAQGQADHDALLALEAVVDNIGIDVVEDVYKRQRCM